MLAHYLSFFIITMLVGVGSLVLGTGRAVAQPDPCAITIEKVAIPADDTTFDFTITGDQSGDFTLSDPSDTTSFPGLGIGETITITEDVPPGWTLESIECVEGVTNCGMDGFSPCLTATIDRNSVTFGCLDNDTASCTFTNVRLSDPIPTLSEWGLIAMAGILGIVGFMVMRRRKATA